jgi:hypothetical protein
MKKTKKKSACRKNLSKIKEFVFCDLRVTKSSGSMALACKETSKKRGHEEEAFVETHRRRHAKLQRLADGGKAMLARSRQQPKSCTAGSNDVVVTAIGQKRKVEQQKISNNQRKQMLDKKYPRVCRTTTSSPVEKRQKTETKPSSVLKSKNTSSSSSSISSSNSGGIRQVFKWFEKMSCLVDMSQYYGNFFDEGYESMALLTTLTMADVKKLVPIMAHQRAVMLAVEELKESMNAQLKRSLFSSLDNTAVVAEDNNNFDAAAGTANGARKKSHNSSCSYGKLQASPNSFASPKMSSEEKKRKISASKKKLRESYLVNKTMKNGRSIQVLDDVQQKRLEKPFEKKNKKSA